MLNGKWDNDPAGYDALRTSWLQQRRNLLVLEFLDQAEEDSLVLEIGSGTGTSLIEMAIRRPDLHFVGVEPLLSYVEYAEQQRAARDVSNIRFLCGFAERLGDVINSGPKASLVISTDVLHHVTDLPAVAHAITEFTTDKAHWLAIEPSWLNPYVFQFCARTAGERNFWPRPFLSEMRKNGWEKDSTRYFTLIPSFIKSPPRWMLRTEKAIEGIPILAGRVALQVRKS